MVVRACLNSGSGGGGGRGLLDLWIAKKNIKDHVLKILATGMEPEPYRVFADICNHESFRAKVGGVPDVEVDQSWIGSFDQSFVDSVDFFKKVVFGNTHDGTLKNLLKGQTAAVDLLAKEPFAGMLSSIQGLLQARKSQLEANSREADVVDQPTSSTVNTKLSNMVPGVEHADEEDQLQLAEYLSEAEAMVDRYIKLVPEADSRHGMIHVLQDTAIAKTYEEADGVVAMMYDSKCAGWVEAHGSFLGYHIYIYDQCFNMFQRNSTYTLSWSIFCVRRGFGAATLTGAASEIFALEKWDSILRWGPAEGAVGGWNHLCARWSSCAVVSNHGMLRDGGGKPFWEQDPHWFLPVVWKAFIFWILIL